MNSFEYAMTYACVRTVNAARSFAAKTKQRVEEFRKDESGMEIIAVVLILLVVVALAVVFHKNIAKIFNTLWDKIVNTFNNNEDDSSSFANPDAAGDKFVYMFNFI